MMISKVLDGWTSQSLDSVSMKAPLGGQSGAELTTPIGAAMLVNLTSESVSYYPSLRLRDLLACHNVTNKQCIIFEVQYAK